MTTQVFKDYVAFLEREDKKINGVSAEFAKEHPDFEKENETNKGCWNCSGCSDCSGCSGCSDCSGCSRCSGCSGCSRCSGCSGCSDCYDCSDCSDCSRCFGCSRCSRCSDCKFETGLENVQRPNAMLHIPKIENIHAAILDAVSKPDAFDMSDWHTCDTTHCRAGWVVTLAGQEGKDLEQQTSTEFAAMMIYKESSPIRVSPVRFYESNEIAMADIKRCAELELSGAVNEQK